MIINEKMRIKRLQKRLKRCCCRACGSELVIKRITFNDISDVKTEIFCSRCNAIEFGIEKAIYNCAKHFVEETDFNYFSFLDGSEMTKKMNIAKVCDILSWALNSLGIINDDGYNVPIEYNPSSTGSYTELTENDLVGFLNNMVNENEKNESD